MRIAYLLGEDLSKHPGLKHKIDSQINYWQTAGHEVFRVQHYNGSIVDAGGVVNKQSISITEVGESKWRRLRRLATQYDYIMDALVNIKPDLTYTRYLYPADGVDRIKDHSGKLIIEINSDDRAEYIQKNWVTGFFNAFFRNRILEKADGLVFVTNELANSESFSAFTSIREVIGNGIEVASFEFLERTCNRFPHLVFIGSPGQLWHGLDKISFLAEKLSDFSFHIIGPDKTSCMQLWGSIPANVIVHGYLSDKDAQRIIKSMDLGIASLALHRNGMQEACPLKVRQYLAQGLPIIVANRDPDIVSEQNFYLQIPNNQKNVESSFLEICDFVERVMGNANIRNEARLYAEKYLSADRKEAERLQFFDKVLSL